MPSESIERAGASEQVTACPSCDSTSIHSTRDDWRCDDCGQRFDEPDRRRRQNDTLAASGTVSTLLDADPEDWP